MYSKASSKRRPFTANFESNMPRKATIGNDTAKELKVKNLRGFEQTGFFGEDRSNEKDPVRLPWQDFPEFRKVLVPLRKFAFQNYIYQRFTNETGEPNLQK